MSLEIERKFLIERPNLKWIRENTDCTVAGIIQTYLGKNEAGFGNRVRRMKINGTMKYYHTAKKSVSGITRIEIEKEISKEEYEKYLSKKRKIISLRKTRYTIKANNLKYEIDIYPFWKHTAILEIELRSEKQKFKIPDYIKVIGEVTNNMDYTNQSLAKKYSYETNKKS